MTAASSFGILPALRSLGNLAGADRITSCFPEHSEQRNINAI